MTHTFTRVSATRPVIGRRRLATLTASTAVSLAITGFFTTCRSADADAPSASSQKPGGKKLTFAFVPGIATDPFYISMGNGAKEEAKKLGVKLIWQGPDEFTPQAQIPILQSLLARKPDALLVTPTDLHSLTASIKSYVAKSIPVFAVDTTIADKSLLVSTITSGSVAGGQLAADVIGKASGGRGTVAILSSKPGNSTTDERAQGFQERMRAKYPGMKVLPIQYDDFSGTKAQVEARSLLLAHPDLVGFFGAQDVSAEGAGRAVKAAGKEGKVTVVGFDAELGEVPLLQSGVISALIVQQPALEGKLAVLYAYKYLTGEKTAIPKVKETKNIVVTTKDSRDPEFTEYYYSNKNESN